MGSRSFGARVPARALGFLFVAGSLLGAFTVTLWHHPGADVAVCWALAALALPAGTAMILRPDRFGRAQLHAMTAVGTVILTVGNIAAGPDIYGVIYLWTGVFAFTFFSMRAALLHVALIGACFAAALAVADVGDDLPLARWLLIMGVLVTVGVLCGRLVDNMAAQRERLARQAGALRRAERRLREVVQTAHDGFLILDVSGTVVDCNAAAERQLGWQRSELVGRVFSSFALPEEERAEHHARLEAIIAGRGPSRRRLEVALLRSDGTRFPAELSASGIEVDGERLVAGFLRDLSERAERDRERRIAETLQRSLLPERLPVVPGVELAARYVPAAAEADVGGDWYDALVLPGERIAVAMGDVAGKGLAAASLVGRLRSALRAYAIEHDDPGTVLERLDRAMAAEFDDPELTTLAFAVIDPLAGTLRWATAGHPPPLVVPPDGPPAYLDGHRGAPLGATPHGRYQTASCPFPPGSTVVLYTDGLVERRDAPLVAGLDLLAASAAAAGTSPGALVDRALADAGVAGGGADDVAMLVLGTQPLGARLTLELATRPESLAAMRSALRRWLGEQAAADSSTCADVVLAVTEACTNAVEHASGDHGHRFTVESWLEDDAIVVTIRSGGRWRPRVRPDHGRGLALMRSLMDAVAIQRDEDGTTVTLRRRVRVAAPVEA